MIEENAEHPVAEPGQPIVDGRAISFGLVTRLDHQDRAVPIEDGGRSVEDAALMSLDVDLDQVEPREAALGSERIEAPQRDLQGVMPGTSGTDPRGAGVGAGRGDGRHRKLYDAVAVADRASDNFGMA